MDTSTIFPHNTGLGSSRDPALLREVGRVTADEVLATGIPWNFGPCVCVSRDERWGRAYESFSEYPALVARMETIVDGLQGRRLGDRLLATARHYAGDGDTEFDAAVAAANVGKPWWEQRYTIDQGITVTSRSDFARIDLSPYVPAVKEHGVGSVMPGFQSVNWIEDGVGNPLKMHAHQELITGVLKGDIGFNGFVISDWEGIHQIPDPDNPTVGGLTPYKVRVGVNAGTDMFQLVALRVREQSLTQGRTTAKRAEEAMGTARTVAGVAGSADRRRDERLRGSVPPQLEQVVGAAQQLPLRRARPPPPAHEPPSPADLLDLPEHRLHGLLPLGIQGLAVIAGQLGGHRGA
jgi:beta-glucosidase